MWVSKFIVCYSVRDGSHKILVSVCVRLYNINLRHVRWMCDECLVNLSAMMSVEKSIWELRCAISSCHLSVGLFCQQQSHCENLVLNFCHSLNFASGCLWSPKLQFGCRWTCLTVRARITALDWQNHRFYSVYLMTVTVPLRQPKIAHCNGALRQWIPKMSNYCFNGCLK